RLHVGDLELDRLVRADRVAEGLAFARVPQALVDTALREPDAERGDRDPALVEDPQELRVTAATLTEQVLLGHPAVVERQLVSVRTVPADLRVLRCHGEPGCARGHQNRRDLLAAVGFGSRDGR